MEWQVLNIIKGANRLLFIFNYSPKLYFMQPVFNSKNDKTYTGYNI